MTWLAKVCFHLRTLFTRQKLDEQLAEELRAHMEMATEANIAKGMSPDEARYAALREFGNVTGAQERTRDERGWVWVDQLGQDLRYAFRQLVRTPGFTAAVVLTLALGIGGTTAIYSMVDTVILNPVAGPEPERMVQLGERRLVQGKEIFSPTTRPVLEAIQHRRKEFSRLAWSLPATLERTTDDFVKVEYGSYVSPEFFATLECSPRLGRGFLADEAVMVQDGLPTQNAVIVLSHAWWQSAWGGDPEILGRVLEMSGRQFTVVGIMPEHFQFPEKGTQFWIPYQDVILRPNTSSGFQTRIYGQLRPGVEPTAVQTMLDSLSRQLMADHPANTSHGALWRVNEQSLNIGMRPLGVALQDGGTWAELRQTLLGLFAAICFVLLIICANVANLVLARLERRQHELAVRSALGAGTSRLMRQLVVENLVLALQGGVVGVLVAAWGLKVLVALNGMPRLRPVAIDGGMLSVILVLSVATALLFGLAPVWRGRRVKPQRLLVEGGMSVTGGRSGRYYLNSLVVAQIAIALVLLTGAGLTLLSVSRVLRIDPGFDPQNLLMVEAQLPWRKYDGPDKTEAVKLQGAFIRLMHERLSTLPGVKAVGMQQMSLWQVFSLPSVHDQVVVQHARVGAGENDAFKAMGVSLLAGRYFDESDSGRPEVVIVNEAMASRFWPGKSALGRKFGGGDSSSPPFEVIGVLNDARLTGYLTEAVPTLYHPFEARWTTMRIISRAPLQFVVRTEDDPRKLIPAIRTALKEIEPGLMMPAFKAAEQVLYDSTLAQRTYRNYLGMFALLGLLLSAVGMYGMLAFSVARRTREIGIRMAVGADARLVRGMILRQGSRLIGLGVAVGLVASLGLARFLQGQLYGIAPTAPVPILGAIAILAATGLMASWLPARRAAKVDPVVALRAE